jgi:hydroxyethylthiazole kinase-like sugar kinase family protein
MGVIMLRQEIHQGSTAVEAASTEAIPVASKAAAASGNRSEILYMSALLGRQSGVESQELLALLNESVESHFRSVRGLSFGAEYLTVLNPDYVTTLVKEYLIHAPTEPVTQVRGQFCPLISMTLKYGRLVHL